MLAVCIDTLVVLFVCCFLLSTVLSPNARYHASNTTTRTAAAAAVVAATTIDELSNCGNENCFHLFDLIKERFLSKH